MSLGHIVSDSTYSLVMLVISLKDYLDYIQNLYIETIRKIFSKNINILITVTFFYYYKFV